MKRRFLLVLLTVLLGLLGAFLPAGIGKTPPNQLARTNFIELPATEQTSYLNNLLLQWQRVEHHKKNQRHKKKQRWALISAELLASGEQKVHVRTVCTESGEGTASPSYSQSKSYDIDTYSNTLCRQLHDVKSGVVLAVADSKQSLSKNGAWRSGHLIFLACTSGYSKRQKGLALGTLGYGALFMHKHPCIMQEGPIVHVVLEREKHGEWSVYVGTKERLGGKAKVSKYAVIKVEKFAISPTPDK